MPRIELPSTTAVIVSEDLSILTLTGAVLQQLNYEILTLDQVRDVQPHLIIYDWSSPPPPEWERLFARSIVLAVVPDDHDSAIEQALNLGVHEIIRKPLNPRLLTLRLRTLAALYQIIASRPDETANRIFNLIGDYVYILSVQPDGRRQRKWWDEAGLQQLTGYDFTRLDAQGGWRSIVYPDDVALLLNRQVDQFSGEPDVIEYRICTAGGEIRWLRDYSEAFQIGTTLHLYGIVQDITKSKRLEADQQEQRRVLDALHNIALILNGTLELNEVLDRILEVVSSALPYDAADVMLVEKGIARVVRHRGNFSQDVEAVIQGVSFAVDEHTAEKSNSPLASNLNTMHDTRKVLVIDDVLNYQRWVKVDERLDVIRAYIGAPLFIGSRLAGFLNLSSYLPNVYTEDHANWLHIFASHVSVALTNAQLYNAVKRHSLELEERVRDLVIMHDVGKRLTSTLNPTEIYRLLFDEVINGIFHANSMSVLMIDETTGSTQTVFTVIEGEISSHFPLPLNLAAVRETTLTRHTQVMGSCIYEPLISRDRVIGVLVVQVQNNRRFDDMESTLFSTMVSQAAIALENAYLLEKERSSNVELEKRVTERTGELLKALEKERELNLLKSRFVTTVSHEFRTPLTAILSANEILEHYDDRLNNEQRTRRFDIIRDSVQDIVRMLEDATVMNEATAGKVHFVPKMVDVVALSQQIVTEFDTENHRQHPIFFHAAHPEIQAFLDPALWRKILREVLLNAAKYSRPHSRIDCTIELSTQSILIKVEDEGIGIPPEDVPYLFEMFHRGTNATHIHGTGLGLAIVKYAIELHGGSITIQPGQSGTLVQIIIPKEIEGEKNARNTD